MKKSYQNHKVKAVTEFWLSDQKLNKFQNLIFYLLILLIPTQFGPHFWPDFSFVKGIRIDYLSPTLHFTDIVILLIFGLWIFSKRKFLISNFKFLIKSQFPILIFAICLIVGIIASKSPLAGTYGLLKLLEFVFFGFYVACNIHKLKRQNVLLMLTSGIIFESSLSILQYFNHGSLQGIFYFFGERLYSSQTPGIANASLGGNLFLRPYGTFPHPNVLSGYLVIVLTIVISNFKFQISNLRKFFYYFTILIGTGALFLTLSRVAIILWLIVISSSFIVNKKSKKLFIGLLVVLVCIGSIILVTPLGARFTELKLTDESVVQRESLIQSSLLMIKDNPIIGVGLNNFLINLPSSEKLQPVHNIFFLIFSETGIIGFGFFTWFICKTYQNLKSKKNYFILYPLSLILILGMFDHYFLTLQQGQLLLSFVLGLCWSFHNPLP